MTTGSWLPPSAAAGALAIVGNCAGLYQYDGHHWFPIEVGAKDGGIDLDMTFPDRGRVYRQPVVVVGGPGHGEILAVSELSRHQLRFSYRSLLPGQPWWNGPTFGFVPGRTYHVALAFDARVQQVTALVDGATELDLVTAGYFTYPVAAPHPAELGTGPAIDGSSPRFTGTIVRAPVTTPICRSLDQRLGSR